MMVRPGFVTHSSYEMQIGKHVFPTNKFRLVKEKIVSEGLVSEDDIESSPYPTDEDLLAVLTPEYLADLRTYRHTRRTVRSELPITKEIVEACLFTAGGSILAAQRAMERGAAVHFGGGYHHGFADQAEGFCYVNDIAIAAMAMIRQGKARKVTIVDTDVHQGNGTAHILQNSPEVFTFSIHQERLYPRKEKSDLDIGLPYPITDEEYCEELIEGLRIAIGQFQPDLVLYAAGVDPYREDQLGGLGLSKEGLKRRDDIVMQETLAKGIPLVFLTAGGYAKKLDDTIELHAQTIRLVLRYAETMKYQPMEVV